MKLRWITGLSHRWLMMTMLKWLGPFCCISWGRISLPMGGRRCLYGGCPSFKISRRLERPARARHVLLTCTHLWTHSVEGLYVSWWGLGSFLRLVLSSYLTMYVFSIIVIMFIHMSSMLKNVLHTFANYTYICVLQTVILQIAFILQIVILQIVPFILQTVDSQTVILQTTTCKLLSCKLSTCKLSSFGILRRLKRPIGARHALLTCTHLWTHSVEGLYILQCMCFPFFQLCSSTYHLCLKTVLYTFAKYTYIYILQIVILQTAFIL